MINEDRISIVPTQGISRGIFTAFAGMVLPFVLMLIVSITGNAEVVEEVAKALVVATLIVGIPSTKGKLLTAVVFGFLFGFSETVLYSNQLIHSGESTVLLKRFLLTVPMHIVTTVVVLMFAMIKRWMWLIGLCFAVVVHLIFNYLVAAA